jgi:signal transduction histidine kinase
MTDELNQATSPPEKRDASASGGRYRKTLITAVLSVSIVTIVPLLIMTGIADHQYREVLRAESTRPMVRFAAIGRQSLESFLSEHLSALDMVVRERGFDQLRDSRRLREVLTNLQRAFGGFIDLGVIDDNGIQISYAGPFELEGRSYSEYDWFSEVSMADVYVSDVFMGYRNVPHFVIAVQDVGPDGAFVLRATIDTDVLNRLVTSLLVQPSWDAFLLNRDGILQTDSRRYGDALEHCPIPMQTNPAQGALVEQEDESGETLLVSYAAIERSPFVLVLLSPREALQAGWLSPRRNLVWFLAISILLILAVVTGGSVYMLTRARESDLKRLSYFHKMEYTNKMATLGRLSAGVAHEINNPLSIITEKAGLLKDLLMLSVELPPRGKMAELVNSVLKSAERCGGITHRLLGFAKHMEVQRESIDLDELIRQVLDFLEKEASYRDIQIVFDYPEEPPTVVSDRGQLQQVFLNIINNAFAAVKDGGHIQIGIRRTDEDTVAVSITDDGVGVAEEHLKHIFDPFFTTKKGGGTGLGLSITYGIVQKLGGQITVTSEVGKGTCFTVALPMGQAFA